MSATRALVILALAGCRKPAPPPVLVDAEAAVEPGAGLRTPFEGPGYWSEAGGLCLDVAEGWVGDTGPPPHVLSLGHTASGVRFDVRAYPIGGPTPDERRPGFAVVFEDEASYRKVPILFPGGTRTWAADLPGGVVSQEWFGEVGTRVVYVELTYPHGQMVAGRDLAAPLLSGLCTVW